MYPVQACRGCLRCENLVKASRRQDTSAVTGDDDDDDDADDDADCN